MNKSTHQKVAFVTGASSGIGKALAFRLLQQNFQLGLCARGEARLDKAVLEMDRSGASSKKFNCDVTNAAEIEAAISATVKRFGQLDLIVANAGYCVYGDFEKLTNEDYERQMRVNV